MPTPSERSPLIAATVGGLSGSEPGTCAASTTNQKSETPTFNTSPSLMFSGLVIWLPFKNVPKTSKMVMY
jgi:hypothetical protein